MESLASEKSLVIKDFISKLVGWLQQPRSRSSILVKLGVNYKPGRVSRCISELKER